MSLHHESVKFLCAKGSVGNSPNPAAGERPFLWLPSLYCFYVNFYFTNTWFSLILRNAYVILSFFHNRLHLKLFPFQNKLLFGGNTKKYFRVKLKYVSFKPNYSQYGLLGNVTRHIVNVNKPLLLAIPRFHPPSQIGREEEGERSK